MKRAGLACTISLLLAAATVTAAPSVRSADVRIAFASPTSCAVDLTLAVVDAREVEHRLDAAPGSRIDLVEVRGAARVGEPADVGTTRALVLRPEAPRYTVRYTVEQPPQRAGRCPLWIPTVPTEGGGQVQIVAHIPAGATATGTMPAFTWSGDEGKATIGHLPAFVRMPYVLEGEPAPWDIARVMDIVSVATLVGATLAWARARSRRGDRDSPRLRL
jgi:hypothetical protein